MITLFLAYELKVAVLIATFYIFWRLLTAKETWHRLNRIVLLTTAVASFVLPLCVITIHKTVEVNAAPMEQAFGTAAIMPETASAPIITETAMPFNWQLLFAIIYIIGVAVVLSRVLLSVWRLHKMATESEIRPLSGGRRIAINEEAKTPFPRRAQLWRQTIPQDPPIRKSLNINTKRSPSRLRFFYILYPN